MEGSALTAVIGTRSIGGVGVAGPPKSGDSFVIGSLADLDLVAPASAGVRTLSVPIFVGALIFLPTGERIVVTVTGTINGNTPEGLGSGIVGDVPAALITGPLATASCLFRNLNVSGSLFDLSAPFGEFINMKECTLDCVNIGMLTDTLGVVGIHDVIASATTSGFQLDGVQGAVAIDFVIFQDNTTTSFVGIEVLATATVAIGLASRDNTGGFVPPNVGTIHRFSALATYPTGPAPSAVQSIDINRCPTVLEGSTVIDETAGNLTSRSLGLTIGASAQHRDSERVGGAEFTDLASPITATHAVANVYEVFPHTNGAGTNLVTLAAEERFSLVRASTGLPLVPSDPPTDWAIQYNGTKPGADAGVSFLATIEAAGAPVDMQATVFHRPGVLAVWNLLTATDTGATGTTEQANRKEQIEGGVTQTAVPVGDQWVFATRVITGTTSTIAYSLRVEVRVK